MAERAEVCWKKFCETGQVSDYLEYRGAVAFCQKSPDAAQREDGHYHAAIHTCGSGTGKSAG